MQTRALVDFGELSSTGRCGSMAPWGISRCSRAGTTPRRRHCSRSPRSPIYAVLRTLGGGRPGRRSRDPSGLLLASVPHGPADAARPWSCWNASSAATSAAIVATRRDLDVRARDARLQLLAALHEPPDDGHAPVRRLLSRLAGAARRTTRVVACNRRADFWVSRWLPSTPARFRPSRSQPYATLAGTGRTRERLRRALLGAAGALPAVLFLGWYHHACFGGVLETGYRHLADIAYQPWHEGGFLGIKTPTWTAFSGSFFSPLRGLFALSPLLLLSVTGMRLLWSARREHAELRAVAVLTILLSVAYVYFTSSFSYASWGWTSGPRHLTGWVPFLLLPAALELEAARTQIGRGAKTGLAVSAILVTSAITFVNYVPDDVSEGVFGLFVPLARDGRILPTALGFVGIGGTAAGWLVVSLVLVAGLLSGAVLLREVRWTGWASLALVVAGVCTLHRVAYQNSEHDRAAQNLLEHVWLTGTDESIVFWSNSGRSGH